MPTYAQVIDGVVHNVYRNVASQASLPAIAHQLVECPETVRPNWPYRNGSFVDPTTIVREPEPLRATVELAAVVEQVAALVPKASRTAEFDALVSAVTTRRG